jgi:hypothetical protein
MTLSGAVESAIERAFPDASGEAAKAALAGRVKPAGTTRAHADVGGPVCS